jgi:polyribonucleotide nucleotidyltransferase
VKGQGIKVADFGAFVEIEPGIEGLVHLSGIRDGRVEKAKGPRRGRLGPFVFAGLETADATSSASCSRDPAS